MSETQSVQRRSDQDSHDYIYIDRYSFFFIYIFHIVLYKQRPGPSRCHARRTPACVVWGEKKTHHYMSLLNGLCNFVVLFSTPS